MIDIIADPAVAWFLFYALVIGVWASYAQYEYLRALGMRREPGGRTARLPGWLQPIATRAPLTAIFADANTPQSDSRLEELRQRFLFRRRVGLVAFVGGAVLWAFIFMR